MTAAGVSAGNRTPLLPLAHSQRQCWVALCGQRIHERHAQDSSLQAGTSQSERLVILHAISYAHRQPPAISRRMLLCLRHRDTVRSPCVSRISCYAMSGSWVTSQIQPASGGHLEEARAHVERGADGEAPGGAALDGQPIGSCVPLLHSAKVQVAMPLSDAQLLHLTVAVVPGPLWLCTTCSRVVYSGTRAVQGR